eukprot:1313041-Ditylum_brightwellii.AAC.1
MQYAPESDLSACLNLKGQRLIQSIVGMFLYYGRTIETTILPVLNKLGSQEDADWLMDYLAMHPNAKIDFFAVNMQLHVDLDAAYLVLP